MGTLENPVSARLCGDFRCPLSEFSPHLLGISAGAGYDSGNFYDGLAVCAVFALAGFRADDGFSRRLYRRFSARGAKISAAAGVYRKCGAGRYAFNCGIAPEKYSGKSADARHYRAADS